MNRHRWIPGMLAALFILAGCGTAANHAADEPAPSHHLDVDGTRDVHGARRVNVRHGRFGRPRHQWIQVGPRHRRG